MPVKIVLHASFNVNQKHPLGIKLDCHKGGWSSSPFAPHLLKMGESYLWVINSSSPTIHLAS